MFDLLQFMQQDGYLSSQELTAIRKTSKELGENPVRLLRSLNIASPEQIQNFLQKHFKVPILKEEALAQLNQNHQIYVPIDIALFYSCFAIGEENNILYVAMEDPSDRGLINQLRFLLSKRIVGICATVYQLAEGLNKIYDIPTSNLKLTTPIERSRGVVGGVRYEERLEKNVKSDDNLKEIDLPPDNKLPNELPDQLDNRELIQKISTTINLALTKFSMINDKEKAIEIFNKLFKKFDIYYEKYEDKIYELNYDLENENTINKLLLPILKKIEKLK
ncbi:MAG: hypothetical protein V4591_09255 [Bdellovibrionota bacterium]